MSSIVQDVVDQDGNPSNPNLSQMQRTMSVFPFSPGESPKYRGAVTDIYKTKDGRFYHVHGGATHHQDGYETRGADYL
jgi:hypothetical protein